MTEWQPIETAPDREWLLAWGLFDLEEKPPSTRILRRVEPNGRGGQHGEFVWADPDTPNAGQWAERIVTHWMPLPSPPDVLKE